MGYLMLSRGMRKEAKGKKKRENTIAISADSGLLDKQAVALHHAKSQVIVTHTQVSE